MEIYNINGTAVLPIIDEEWTPWYLNARYQVSTQGRVRTASGNLVRIWKNKAGYAIVKLKDFERPVDVHKMVQRSFVFNAMPLTNTLVDHINGDRMDARLENLRYSNHWLNSHNRLGVKGYYTRGNKFVATIKCQGRKLGLGTYTTAKEARAAYLEASERLHEIL